MARNKQHILVNNIIDDDRFSDGIGWKGLSITNCICVPIVTLENECFAVIELYRDNGEEYKLVNYFLISIYDNSLHISFS